MEILPCEEVECAVDAKMQLLQDGPIYIKQAVYCSSAVSTQCNFSEDTSDEDDHKTSLQVTSEESSVCCVCGDNFPILRKLIEHFKTHTAEVHCHLCLTKFERVMSLALHLKNAHSTHSLLCEICGSLFSCTWHLNGHMAHHQKDKMEAEPVVKLEPTEEISIDKSVNYSDLRTAIKDHSYFILTQPPVDNTCDATQKCTDGDATSTNQVLHIKTETVVSPSVVDKQNNISCSSLPKCQSDLDHLTFGVKEENNIKNGLGETAVYEVAAEEEIKQREDDESSNNDDGNPDFLPPGDTAYNPDEDLSSDSDSNESHRFLQKIKSRKQQSPDKRKSANTNLELTEIAEKFGFQSDSPFCCYGKFANLGKHMDDCSKKMTFTCSVCSLVCDNKETLQKHIDEKHPVAGYICAFCRNIFPSQDRFKNHICWKRLLSKMNLEATPVTELPVVRLSNSSSQGAPSAPVSTSQNTIKMIKITQTADKGLTVQKSLTIQKDLPPAVTSSRPTEGVTVHQLLQKTTLASAKVANSAPKAPQTLPKSSSCVVRPKVPVHTPMVVRPLLSNPLRIPPTSNPPFSTQVVVSFSPTVNISTPAVVSGNKPVLRPTSAANIRPVPVNVSMINPVICPTLCVSTPSNPPLPTQVNAFFSPTVNIGERKEMLQKNTANNHHLAGYVCTVCHNIFNSQDNIKNHICWKRPRGNVNLPAIPVNGPILPITTPSNPTQVNVSFSPSVKGSIPTLLSTNKPVLNQTSGANITPVPLNVPLITSVSCPTLCIPNPSNPPLPNQVTVSFSPTANISTSALVSDNKPVLRQMSTSNIVPVPVNVPLITSVTCPTLVNALTGNNHPQVPVQVPLVKAPLQIVGMFMNQSRDLTLLKRVEQSWRSKTIFPCRHCGAVSRQPSLRVRHRYLHRGSRRYRCQCGRAFQRQMHLLRHQVQHAESVRFVCSRCGNTFKGANKLTWHKQKRKNVSRCAKKTCKPAFDCSCGQMFARPSALLWHMLKNSKQSKHTKKLSI